MKLPALHTVSVKCPYSELFWCVFSRIRTEHGPEKLWIQSLFTLWLVLPNHMNKIMHICDISNVTEITTLLISPILLNVSALRQHYWKIMCIFDITNTNDINHITVIVNIAELFYIMPTLLKLSTILISRILLKLRGLLTLPILLKHYYWNYWHYWYCKYYWTC